MEASDPNGIGLLKAKKYRTIGWIERSYLAASLLFNPLDVNL